MFNLKDRMIPITIYKYGGQVKVFRKATLQALMSGKFRMPKILGKQFFRRGVENAFREIPELLAQARHMVVMIG